MGSLRGDLTALSVANLVQALVLDRSQGLLTVESGVDRRVLRVAPSGIRIMRGSQRCHRLERLLRRLGPSTSDPTDPFAAKLTRLVRDWMLEEICELFTWSRGTFDFERTDPSQLLEEGPFGPFSADCDVNAVALEAARWADELPRIKATIRDLRQVPVMTTPCPLQRTPARDSEALQDILRLIDGTRPVIQILQLSIFPRFVVLEILHRLAVEGALRLDPPALPGVESARAA